MKKIYSIIVVLAMILLNICQSEASELKIYNPNYSSWYSYQGDIRTCSLFVSPKGVYCQYDLEMAVGVQNYSGSSADSLEIHYQFNLPKTWTINDSWLWVGDTIVPAMLIDRAKATEIYETLVSRRTDPSLLTWDTYGAVNLRVYPLFVGQSRRFRISFLAPADWTMDNVVSEFTSILLPNNLKNVEVFIRDNEEFKFNNTLYINNALVDANSFEKDSIEDIQFAKYSIYNLNYNDKITTKYERTNKNNIFFDIFEKNNEKYYQMAMLYPDLSENKSMKKVLFAYDLDKNSEQQSGIRTKLATSMMNILNAKDSFNLLLSANQNKFVFDKWVPATQQNIDSAITALNNHQINSLTFFHNLILSICDYVKDETEFDRTSVMILSSDITYNTAEKSIDEYLNLKNLLNYRVKINIALIYQYYYYNGYTPDYYYGGLNFRYNELLCKNIAAYTQGMQATDYNFITYDYNSGYIFNSFLPLFENYYNQNLYGTNVQIQMNDGFSYTDNIISSNSNSLLMCGKLYGENDMTVKITGFDGTTPFMKTYTVPYSISNKKYRNNQFWAFAEMMKLSKEQQTRNITEEIVKLSMKNRVISQYTAFLALEPWLMDIDEKYSYDQAGDKGNEDGGGENSAVSSPTNNLDVKLNYDNQNNSLSINIKNSDPKMSVEIIRIYDISGRELQKWQIEENNNSELNLTWEFGDEASSGTFIVMIETNKGTVTKKINIVK